jgi:hypothetical protein
LNFDFGEVLSRAWQITWKHKVLWIIGLLYAFLSSLMFLLIFAPMLFPLLVQQSGTGLALAVLAGSIMVFLLFILALYPIGTLAQTCLTLGVLEAQEEGELSSVRELLKRSSPYFWRVLGLMALFAAGMIVLMLIIQGIGFLLTIVTLGFGALCFAPLSLLMYPVMYGSIIWMELSMSAVILDNMPAMEAARQGWQLLRNNWLALALMALIIYFGVGMITGFVVIPLMIPAFLWPLALVEHETNWILVAAALAGLVIFIPLFTIVSGWAMIFTKANWILTYQRLTRTVKPQPLLEEAAP